MKNNTISFFSSVIWFVVTGIYIATICADLYYKVTPLWLILLHIFTALLSLVAAVVNWGRYKEQKCNE